MNWLAWDTSTIEASLALRTGRGLFTASIDAKAGTAERLLQALDTLLQEGKTPLAAIDAFAVGTGPGSFTGLRIGIATARSLAFVLGRPLHGISSLEAACRERAQALLENGTAETSRLAWARNAFGGEVYARVGSLREHLEGGGLELCLSPDAWNERFAREAPDFLCGEGASLLSPPSGARVQAGTPVSLATQAIEIAERARARGEPGAWETVVPRYLKGSSAEEKLRSLASSAPLSPAGEGR